MANMSASILRNLVSSVFKVPSYKVRLSGEISSTYTPRYSPQTDYDGSRDYDSVWGFHPTQGFVPIAVTHSLAHLLGNKYKSDGESMARHYESLDTFKGVEEFIFFVINNCGVRYANVWDISDEWDTWTLYKAPNFAAHWAAIEEADVQRWKVWLNA